MKKIFVFMTIVMVLASCGNKQDADTCPYDILGTGQYPVGMWVTPSPAADQAEAYRTMSECGINFVNGFAPHHESEAQIFQAMDQCAEFGLRYFVSRSETLKNIQAYAEDKDPQHLEDFLQSARKFAGHPAYAGELLMDEPGKPLIPVLSEFTSRYESEFPEHMWHVNLFPTYATGGIRTHSYEDYITTWLDLIHPKYLSYDSYALLRTEENIIPDYFYNLDYIRKVTQERNIPFWTFIQTLSIAGTPGVPDKREPSETDLRWQVWTNLAFGAKGLQYFCYWTPGSHVEQFGNALVTQTGEKTEKYAYVQRLNRDIIPVADILLTCSAEGVIQQAQHPFRLSEPIRSCGPLLCVSGGDALVGCFRKPDGRYCYLISPQLPGTSCDVILEFDRQVKKMKTLLAGQSDKLKNTGQLEARIPVGEALFVELL